MASDTKRARITQIRDRRKSRRRRFSISAKIFYGGDNGVTDCVILDISETGAQLRPRDMSSCPKRFALQLHGKRFRDCEVVWRNRGVLGVRFTSSWRGSSNLTDPSTDR